MEANGQGIMQGNITDTGTGVSYLQTVVVDPTASGAATSLGFSDENFVFADGINSNNIGLQQRINDAGMSTLTVITEGAFETGGDETDPGSTTGDGITMHLDQTVSLGSPDFQSFSQVGSNANKLQAVNQRTSGQGTDNRFTVRQALGSFGATASGTLGDNTFENEFLAGPGGVDYSPGDELKVVWIGQDAPDGSQFGTQDYVNITTDITANRNGQTGDMGLFTDNGPWLWNTTFFGTAPAAPPTTPAFP